MSDFTVLRGTTVITAGNTTKTLTQGVDYTLPLDTLGAPLTAQEILVRITSSRHSGMGQTVGGGNQGPTDIGVVIETATSEPTQIVFARAGTTNDTRVDYEIICWTGPSGGANRFWVRRRGTEQLLTTTHSLSTVTSISNINKTMLLVTGSRISSIVRGEMHGSQATLDYASNGSGGWVIEAKVGAIFAFSVQRISYAVVEFNSGWRDVQRIECSPADIWTGEAGTVWTSGSPGVVATFDFTQASFPSSGLVGRVGSSTAPAVALLDRTKTFIHQQYRIPSAAAQGNDDLWETVEIDGQGVSANPLTHVLSRRSATNDATIKRHVFWIAEWVGTATRAMSVTHHRRYHGTPGGAEEEVDNSNTATDAWSPAIPTVPDFDEASVVHYSTSSSGTGSGTPRGLSNFRLTAANILTTTRSETSQPEQQVCSIVSWPHDELVVSTPAGSRRLHGVSSGLELAEGLTGGAARAQGF